MEPEKASSLYYLTNEEASGQVEFTEPDGGWSLIPDILYEYDLSDRQILLWGKIKQLSGQEGFCRARNEKLGRIFDVERETISSHLSSLEDAELIRIAHDEDDRYEGGKQRRIYPMAVNTFHRRTMESKRRQQDEQELGPEYIEDVIDKWNEASFVRDTDESKKHPAKVSRVRNVSKGSKRYRKLTNRVKEEDFDFEEIVKSIGDQPWLSHDAGWGGVDFDWVIKNDENYDKILGYKYLGMIDQDEIEDYEVEHGWREKESLADKIRKGKVG